jgi:ABC-type multidrug transport system fused ATPase/permease subunit
MDDENQQVEGENPAGLWSGLRELYAGMSPSRRRQFYFVLVMMVAGAFAELATIGAVLPFLALLADPHRIDHVPALAAAFTAVGAISDHQRLVAATVLFVLLAVVAAIVRLKLSWTTQNFVFGLGHEVSVEIQRRLLLQPYTFHINHNTSGLIASLEKVGVIVFSVMQQVMLSITAGFIALMIIAGLIYIDPLAAISAAAIFSLVYLLVSVFSRRRLRRNSESLGSSYDERIKIVQESLGGIRDVIIDSSQSVYVEAFRRVDERFNLARANTSFISTAPRFVIEGLGMILIAVLAGVISGQKGGFAAALPILGALALGAQRLLPLVQQVYLGWSIATGHALVLEQVLELMRLPVNEETARTEGLRPLPVRQRITLEGVSFAYQAAARRPSRTSVSKYRSAAQWH